MHKGGSIVGSAKETFAPSRVMILMTMARPATVPGKSSSLCSLEYPEQLAAELHVEARSIIFDKIDIGDALGIGTHLNQCRLLPSSVFYCVVE